eukprot:GHVS01102399.1.p2 GENE.GHVS01102399.1~~GHVS01102399.1.p2  ORF type:complete len:152 (-),score=35.55 GHVS01102399.1:517-972(-)
MLEEVEQGRRTDEEKALGDHAALVLSSVGRDSSGGCWESSGGGDVGPMSSCSGEDNRESGSHGAERRLQSPVGVSVPATEGKGAVEGCEALVDDGWHSTNNEGRNDREGNNELGESSPGGKRADIIPSVEGISTELDGVEILKLDGAICVP